MSKTNSLDVVVIGYQPGAETARMLADLHEYASSGFHLFYHDNTDNRKSLSAWWNDLANLGSSEFVAFLNPDVIPCPDWDQRMIAALIEHAAVGVVIPCPIGGAQCTYLDKTFTLHDPPTNEEMRALANWATEKGSGKQHLYDYGCERGPFFSAMLRREEFKQLNGFDERLPFYGQDHEIQDRLISKGRKCAQIRTCPFWNGNSIPTNKAIQQGIFDLGFEQRRMGTTLEKIRSGELPRWDKLSKQERSSIRFDPAFQMQNRL